MNPSSNQQRFLKVLNHAGLSPLRSQNISTLQVNVGKRCNQACHHCHVEAGPKRTEDMSQSVAERVIELIMADDELETLDITGGAPELNAQFRSLALAGRKKGLEVIDRCNLTILFEPGQEDLAAFLADNKVHIVASLPCYSRDNVEKQRGLGVFNKSVEALKILNNLGFGKPASDLILDLVYNPVGPNLPPAQATLEADYKQRLREDFGIEFNGLFTITNVPINRFEHSLLRDNQYNKYMSLLQDNFNPGTVEALMCRSLVSVGYEGTIYDCDFNQMLEMEVSSANSTIFDIESLAELRQRPIKVADHCLACTAGSGSSCTGALA